MRPRESRPEEMTSFGAEMSYGDLGIVGGIAGLSLDAPWSSPKVRARQAPAITFFTAAEILWRIAWKPFEPSLVIQFICSDRLGPSNG